MAVRCDSQPYDSETAINAPDPKIFIRRGDPLCYDRVGMRHRKNWSDFDIYFGRVILVCKETGTHQIEPGEVFGFSHVGRFNCLESTSIVGNAS